MKLTVVRGNRKAGIRKGSEAEILSWHTLDLGSAQLSIRFPALRPPILIMYATVPVCTAGDTIELSRAAPGARYSVRRGHSISARIDP